jgi:PAS domain S-box-containing protein
LAASRQSVGDIQPRGATFDVLAEALPNLVWIADARGRITYVNTRWYEYTGFTAESLSAERGAPKGIVHPGDLARTWDLWERSLQSGVPYEISYRLRSAKTGAYRWFLARAVPVFDDDANVVGWAGAATDIEEQVRATERSRFFSDAANILSSSLDRRAIVDGFSRLAVERFSDACIVVVREPGGSLDAIAVAHKNEAVEQRLRRVSRAAWLSRGGPVERVLETGQPALLRDISDEAVRAAAVDEEHLAALEALRMRSVIVVPLVVAGTLTGTISFVSSCDEPRYDDLDMETAAAVARQMALALENVRSFAAREESTRRLLFLSRLTDHLFATPISAVTLQRLVDTVVSEVAEWAVVVLLQPTHALRVEAVAHRDPALKPLVERLRGQRVMRPERELGFTGQLQRHKTYATSQLEAQDLAQTIQPYLVPVFAQLRPRSAITVPLFLGEVTFGALIAYSGDANHEYTDADCELFGEIGQRASLALEHMHSFERERRLAQTLQEATLPAQLPAVEGALLSTVYLPAASDAQVGGDWYDAFALSDGLLLLSIGDVTGRGLQAAVVMAKLRHALNVVAMYESNPARILDAAERVVLQRYPDAMATAFVAIFDTVAHRLVYANAGHPYPFARMSDGSIRELKAEGLPIGLRTLGPPAAFESCSTKEFALLAFYTDGLTEATRNLDAGERRLREVLSTDAALFARNPAELIAASCLPKQVRDDVALLVVTFPRSTGWTFDADNARGAQSARFAFIARLRESASAISDFAAAELIFGELVGNVVRHAPGPIDITLEWKDDRAILHVIDRGPGFESAPLRRVGPLSEAGRGLWLIRHFGRDLKVEHIPGFGNHVRVELPVDLGANVVETVPDVQPAGMQR